MGAVVLFASKGLLLELKSALCLARVGSSEVIVVRYCSKLQF